MFPSFGVKHYLPFAADEKIALLGAIQSLFEGSMYTFVFLWTPALSPNNEDIPHGFIFATFMLASMLGSSLASRLLARSTLRVESYMQIVFLVSSVSLMLPIITSVCYQFQLTSFSLYILIYSFSAVCLLDVVFLYSLVSQIWTASGYTLQGKRWKHLIFWLYSASWLLYL